MNDYKKINVNNYNKLPSKESKYNVIHHYSNGNIRYEEYLINDKWHREAGPAFIEYYENGNIRHEGYFINDLFHREDGPARIWYYQNGNIEYERYFLCDKFFLKKGFYSQKIQAILDIAKMMDTWESKLNFIKLSLNKEFNE